MRKWIFAAGLVGLQVACGTGESSGPKPDATPVPDLTGTDDFEAPENSPVVESVWPDRASSKNYLTIRGRYFGDDPSAIEVQIGGTRAEILTVSADRLLVAGVPSVSAAEELDVLVSVEGRTSESGQVTAVPGGDVSVVALAAPAQPEHMARASDGTVYLVDRETLLAIAPSGRVSRTFTEGQPWEEPRGVAVRADGQIAVVDAAGTLWLADPIAGSIEALASSFDDPTAVGADGQGSLYVLEAGTDTVWHIDGFVPSEHGTFDAAGYGTDIEIIGGDIYVASPSNETIYGATLEDGAYSVVASGQGALRGLGADGDDLLAVGELASGEMGVARVNPADGNATTVLAYSAGNTLSAPRDVLSSGGGAFLISDYDQASVFELSDGAKPRVLAQTLAGSYSASEYGDKIYTAVSNVCQKDAALDAVVEIGREGATRVVTSLVCPYAVAVDSDGTIVATDMSQDADDDGWFFDSRLVRIDSKTGATSELAPAVAWSSPMGLAIAANGDIYVSDYGLAQIAHYDAKGDLVETMSPSDLWSFASVLIKDGELLVSDYDQHTVAAIGSNVASGGSPRFMGSGELAGPWGLAQGTDGSVYVADWDGNRIARFDGQEQYQLHADLTGYSPAAMTVDDNGTLNAFDFNGGELLRITP